MRLSVCVMADIDEIDFYPHVESLGYDSAWVTDSHLWKRDVLLEGTAGLGHGDRLFPPGARPVVATPEGLRLWIECVRISQPLALANWRNTARSPVAAIAADYHRTRRARND